MGTGGTNGGKVWIRTPRLCFCAGMLHLRRWTSLSVSSTQDKTAAVCVFSARYFRWLYFGTFSLLSAAVRNPRKFAERLLLVLKGWPASRSSTGPRVFWADPVRGRHSRPAVRTEQVALWPQRLCRGCGQTLGKCLAPSAVSTLEGFVVWCGRLFFYARKTEEPIPSWRSTSINMGVSSACQHLTPNVISTQDCTVTHACVKLILSIC